MLWAEIPGIDPDDVDVSVSGETVVIRGEKKAEHEREGQTSCSRERTVGAFERTFTLPVRVAAHEVTAEAKHGVLTVTVQKAEEARPRKIAIRTR